ncbi:hypothetical protein GC170_09730 [bacterium]|nr:hypothetical protein [bacterium]
MQAWAEDLHSLRLFLVRNAWPIIISTGVALRVFGYFCARWFWLDESMLLSNVRDAPVFRIVGPLKQEQVVPPGFLLSLRAIHSIFGMGVLPLRFPALIAGTAAFVLFVLWARRFLPFQVAWISSWLMALNADALYYCQEMKPYAFDLLATVVVLILLAQDTRENSQGSVRPRGPAARDRWLRLAFLLTIPWFSIASVFPLSAYFLTLMLKNRGDKAVLKSKLPFALGWTVSFLAAWGVEKSQVVEGSVLWNFWDFAFLKPLRPLDTLCVLADNLINPLHFATSYDWPWLMFPWIAALSLLLILGLRHMLHEARWLTIFSVAATSLVALASFARFYPFHGRTIVFLLPCVLPVFAYGLARLPIRSARTRKVILVFALVTPTLSAAHIRPFSDSRLISFDGDLEYDHFSPRYGVVKRANTPPPKLNTPK